jgi:hypothetical protein
MAREKAVISCLSSATVASISATNTSASSSPSAPPPASPATPWAAAAPARAAVVAASSAERIWRRACSRAVRSRQTALASTQTSACWLGGALGRVSRPLVAFWGAHVRVRASRGRRSASGGAGRGAGGQLRERQRPDPAFAVLGRGLPLPLIKATQRGPSTANRLPHQPVPRAPRALRRRGRPPTAGPAPAPRAWLRVSRPTAATWSQSSSGPSPAPATERPVSWCTADPRQ